MGVSVLRVSPCSDKAATVLGKEVEIEASPFLTGQVVYESLQRLDGGLAVLLNVFEFARGDGFGTFFDFGDEVPVVAE